ncbi:MAG TPA: transcriptional repressor LexA [Gemmatimonadaceae bacterium]|nr:transcriptional repressor LexA [Gemmatimonadaceae bacterium]
MTQPLTAMERRVYEYLLDFTAENTFQPSIREIGKRFRIKSTKTVSDILQALAAKGYIERDASRSRGVRLLGFAGATRTMPVPFYGRIHAGEPALVPEYREGFITMDRRFVPSERAFFLRVVGDSMVGAGIHDGDLVVVNPEARVQNGDIVAARLGDGAMIKRYKAEGDRVTLRAENPEEPDYVVTPADDFAVLGVVCGIFRPFFDRGAVPSEPIEIVTI